MNRQGAKETIFKKNLGGFVSWRFIKKRRPVPDAVVNLQFN